MKILYTLVALFFTVTLLGQNNVVVKIHHKIGADNFMMDDQFYSNEGYNLKIKRLEYYVNRFTITHDGGQITAVDEHFLIDANEETNISLGALDITQVESIKFSIGVHPGVNHLDPAIQPNGHPLAPQNPSMHWGWTSGYRFVALEGLTGENNAFTFEVHALGDDNYQSLTVDDVEGIIDGNNLTINLDADYLGIFYNMDVSSGVIVHGEDGLAITLLENFASRVFYPQGLIPVKTIDPNFEGKFQIQPNPSFDNNTHVILNLPTAANYQLTLTDLTGRVIQTQTIESDEQNIEIKSTHSGVFFIHLWRDGKPVAIEKWIVK